MRTICKYSDYAVFYVFFNSKHNHYKDGTANPFLICPAAEWPQMGKDVCLLSVGWQGLSLVEHLEVIPLQSKSVACLAGNICVTDKRTSLCESLLSLRLWNTLYPVYLMPGESCWWGLWLRRRQGPHSVSSPYSLCSSSWDIVPLRLFTNLMSSYRFWESHREPTTSPGCGHPWQTHAYMNTLPGTMNNGQNTLFSSKEFN